MNIAELLIEQAERRPQSVALVDVRRGRSRSLTFAELEQDSGRFAMQLHQAGLTQGDAVLVLQPMSLELYIVMTAIFRLGLVAMFLDPSAGCEHIKNCCELQQPKALIGSPRAHLLRFKSADLRRIPFKFSTGRRLPGAVSLSRVVDRSGNPPTTRMQTFEDIQPCMQDSPALLTFTSGSTGEPKAVLRTHGFLLAQHRTLEETLVLTPGEVELSTLPMFVLANLASGLTSVIPDTDLRRPDAIDPVPVVAQIETHQVTRFSASPAFYERIVEYCSRQKRTFPRLTKVLTGGGPVTANLLDQLQRIAPQAKITSVYGSTEAEPIACIAREEIAEADTSNRLGGHGLLAGRPVPMIQLRILKHQPTGPVGAIGPYSVNEFQAACQPPGEAGEIVVSGEHVLSGYMNGFLDFNHVDTNKFDVENVRWHRTGDAGYLDHRGRLWLLGRCSARIDDQHGTLYPFTVEHAVRQHDYVRRSAVVSIHGERVLAVELCKGRWPESRLHFQELLESLEFAHVSQIRVVRKMPVDRRHNSKIDYPTLLALLEKIA